MIRTFLVRIIPFISVFCQTVYVYAGQWIWIRIHFHSWIRTRKKFMRIRISKNECGSTALSLSKDDPDTDNGTPALYRFIQQIQGGR